LSLEEQLAAASLGGAENFVKQLEEYALSKGMSRPTYKVSQRKPYVKLYHAHVKVSIKIAQTQKIVFVFSSHETSSLLCRVMGLAPYL
jgi:hypothetical protein